MQWPHTAAAAVFLWTLAGAVHGAELGVGWPSYGGDAGGTRYSSLRDITPQNVARLVPAWEIHTGDVSDGSGDVSATSFQATPILFEDTLYVCTPFNRILALDPDHISDDDQEG